MLVRHVGPLMSPKSKRLHWCFFFFFFFLFLCERRTFISDVDLRTNFASVCVRMVENENKAQRWKTKEQPSKLIAKLLWLHRLSLSRSAQSIGGTDARQNVTRGEGGGGRGM